MVAHAQCQTGLHAGEHGQEVVEHLLRSGAKLSAPTAFLEPAAFIAVIALGRVPRWNADDFSIRGDKGVESENEKSKHSHFAADIVMASATVLMPLG